MGEYDERLQRALSETPEISGDGERFSIPEPDVRLSTHPALQNLSLCL